jgi:hypothetical protein
MRVRWTQWIFLKLFERGLAYQAEVPVNWCPPQGTVLANEEVKDGKYVETGDCVEKRLMRQAHPRDIKGKIGEHGRGSANPEGGFLAGFGRCLTNGRLVLSC